MNAKLSRAIAEIERSGAASHLASINRGLEKESLRVSPNGVLSSTPHPRTLGSALSHSSITTDYSESLLEFITPVFTDVEAMLSFLTDLHLYTYKNIGDEILWTNSMPCILHGDESIPIADYGSSNIGFMKHVYRRGLAWRYGRLMQTIAGVHYNFSLPEAFFTALDGIDSADNRSAHYFNLIRNFHRHCWLVLYLFGSSPAICQTFVEGRKHNLDVFGEHSFYLPKGTTLRMSDLGYQNSAQSSIRVCTNSLSEYVRTLRAATEQSWPAYEEIGVKVDGEYRQLNTNLLQIENEFYTVIRPKRTINSGEKPSCALNRRGVEYIEVRSIDLDPFSPIGVSQELIQFMDAFLLFCMFEPSPPISVDEDKEIAHNRNVTVMNGRDPATQLHINGEARSIRDEAVVMFEGISAFAEMLDRYAGGEHVELAERERHKFIDPDTTPSAIILDEMREHGDAYFEFAMRWSQRHKRYFDSLNLSPEKERQLKLEAESSLERTAELEAEQKESFDEFLRRYMAASC